MQPSSTKEVVAKGLKPQIIPLSVIPAKAGIHLKPKILTFGRMTDGARAFATPAFEGVAKDTEKKGITKEKKSSSLYLCGSGLL